MSKFAEPMTRLIDELKKLPGIGSKSAQRLAFHILRSSDDDAEALAVAVRDVKASLRLCSICNNITDVDPRCVLQHPTRNQRLVCVVEEPTNIAAVEKTKHFNGVYHVLHGSLSPLHGVGPEQLRIANLTGRVDGGQVDELIIATNPTVEGEATEPTFPSRCGVRDEGTRIAMGIPVGSDIEYERIQITMLKAMEGLGAVRLYSSRWIAQSSLCEISQLLRAVLAEPRFSEMSRPAYRSWGSKQLRRKCATPPQSAENNFRLSCFGVDRLAACFPRDTVHHTNAVLVSGVEFAVFPFRVSDAVYEHIGASGAASMVLIMSCELELSSPSLNTSNALRPLSPTNFSVTE